MFNLMQGASVLTLATALALGPVAAAAQTATDETTGTDVQTDAPIVDETAQDTVIPPVEGETGTDTAQDAVPPVEDGMETDTAQEAVPPAEDGMETDTAQTEPLSPATEGDGEMETAGAEPVDGTIQMQDQNTVLMSDLMGARIYNSADETVGSIDDAIVSIDGTVEGVVIGVGGFLGIGQKSVAIEMSQLSVQTDESGDVRLFLDSTREALEAAPDFVTVAEQDRLREIEEVQPTQGATGTEGGLGTGAVPATD